VPYICCFIYCSRIYYIVYVAAVYPAPSKADKRHAKIVKTRKSREDSFRLVSRDLSPGNNLVNGVEHTLVDENIYEMYLQATRDGKKKAGSIN
jgi:galactose mutarotase-like enzyme